MKNCNNCTYLTKIRIGRNWFFICNLGREDNILSRKDRKKGCYKWEIIKNAKD